MTKFLVLALLVSTPAWAFVSGADERPYLLTTGAGIASPSMTSAMVENPAGLTYNTRTKFLVSGQTPTTSFDPVGAGATFFTGNGTVGVGLGILSSDVGNIGDTLALGAGLAAEAKIIKTSFGVSLAKGLTGGDAWGLNVGAIYNKEGDLRIGVTAFDLTDKVSAVGVGVAYEFGRYALADLDGTWDPHAGGMSLKPGIKVHLDILQLSLGYGFNVINPGAPHLQTGVAGGVGFNLGDHIAAQVYYGQIDKLYAGLLLRI